ncbi:DNA-directed RNA polymerase subunit delta [Bacillus sp. 2205SS5-2]|uniref:DNA-directed RNA polymerase subunit delta n=1 Tax=Bacillus sp. 2205SS5-2 TaxID=3109031 RepID=UPI00300429EE
MNLQSLSKEELKQTSFIELAFEILKEKKQAIPFNELLKAYTDLKGLKTKNMGDLLAQFYTDLNFDGRFLAIGDNKWGLRAWYPVDQIEEETVPTIKTRKKKAKAVVEDDFDEVEEEDLDFDELDDFEEEDLLEDDSDDDFEDDDDEEEEEFEGDAIIEGDEDFSEDEDEEEE